MGNWRFLLSIGALLLIAVTWQNCSSSDLVVPSSTDDTGEVIADVGSISGASQIDVGFGVGFTLRVQNPQEGVAIQWYFEGQLLAGETGTSLTEPSAAYENEGAYQVKLGDAALSFPVNVTVGDATSCLDIRNASEGSLSDGLYTIDPDGGGAIAAFDVNCDMTTDGGGWTELTLAQARDIYTTDFVVVDGATIQEIDAEGRPYTRDGAGDSTHHFTITLPFSFSAFYLSSYAARANPVNGDTSDIVPGNFIQSSWAMAFVAGGAGDISFGSAFDSGPVTSFAAQGTSGEFGNGTSVFWPANGVPMNIGSSTTAFRIGWGEGGAQEEGWYPWYSGSIYLR